MHDGLLSRKEWHQGQRVLRIDFNEEGKAIRFHEFVHGRLKKRTYKNPVGVLVSEELNGPDGFKTEYIFYYTRPGLQGQEHAHWWYNRGRPVKKTTRGKVEFDMSTK